MKKVIIVCLLVLLACIVKINLASAKTQYALYQEDGLIYAAIYKSTLTEEYVDILVTVDYDEKGRPVNEIVRLQIISDEQRSRIFPFDSMRVSKEK